MLNRLGSKAEEKKETGMTQMQKVFHHAVPFQQFLHLAIANRSQDKKRSSGSMCFKSFSLPARTLAYQDASLHRTVCTHAIGFSDGVGCYQHRIFHQVIITSEKEQSRIHRRYRTGPVGVIIVRPAGVMLDWLWADTQAIQRCISTSPIPNPFFHYSVLLVHIAKSQVSSKPWPVVLMQNFKAGPVLQNQRLSLARP